MSRRRGRHGGVAGKMHGLACTPDSRVPRGALLLGAAPGLGGRRAHLRDTWSVSLLYLNTSEVSRRGEGEAWRSACD